MTKPTVPEVLPLVQALYRGETACTKGGVGGHLHVVLDDGNVDDGNVAGSIIYAREEGCTSCIELGELLLCMSKTQRSKLASMDHCK